MSALRVKTQQLQNSSAVSSALGNQVLLAVRSLVFDTHAHCTYVYLRMYAIVLMCYARLILRIRFPSGIRNVSATSANQNYRAQRTYTLIIIAAYYDTACIHY